jgi:ankyrin repeat protein
LVENGADTEHYGQFGYTALINACKGRYEDFSCFGDLTICHDLECIELPTNISKLSLGGHIEIVTVLIDWGANIEAISKTGYNCIYYASVRGHANVVQHLLLSGEMKTSVRSIGIGSN